jgi:hypothetical protein
MSYRNILEARMAQYVLISVLISIHAAPTRAEVFVADPNVTSGPSYYRNIVDQLSPGDTLQLPSGVYGERLNLSNLDGSSDAWITIPGPETGDPAVITTDSTCCHTVQLGNASYITIKNITIDSNSEALNTGIDAINAKDGATHDIRIENCDIQGVSLHQQTVGISTKSTAWNWHVVGNTIREAGTGIYFGDSNGGAPFVAGLIEHNLFVDTIGYNMQVKHQNDYSAPPGMPGGVRRTIIRHNVFLKRRAQSSWPVEKVDGPRPNLLVDGFPASGTGANDMYEIYGNFFYQNPDGESHIQASGRVAIHDNIFADVQWTSILLTDHNRPLNYADVYNNTIFGGQRGIRFASGARQSSSVVGNLVFATEPISGNIGTQTGNLTDSISNADVYVTSPSNVLGSMDFYPLQGQGQGDVLDLSRYVSQTDYAVDFNGDSKGAARFRGAYAGDGINPGWHLNSSRKPASVASGSRPNAPTDLTVDQ